MPSYGPCPFGGGAGYRRVCLTQSNFEDPASLRWSPKPATACTCAGGHWGPSFIWSDPYPCETGP